mmetsp:Transcript_66273/g.97015  ORF Transcript_66273/g.97015 Transcript_66273/m.97015 type:complete len:298 (+) Transcript_66273:107-1000(+)
MESSSSSSSKYMDAMELEDEQKLQHYTGLTCIGSGKFATVHRAQHTPTGQSVALKKVQVFMDIMESSERHEVVREAKLLQKVDHIHIIKCYDSWIEDGEFYVCLELCDKGDLSNIIKRQQADGTSLSLAQVCSYSFQLSDALMHMHERKMMHRDIKPANVFLAGENGNLKLGDLGLGRLFGSRTLETVTVVGTPYYMAPEVAQNRPYSYPADVWSLGCVVYELCNLTSPFWEKNLNLYLLGQKIVSGRYPPVNAEYGTVMADMIAAMITVPPDARPRMQQIRAAYLEQEAALEGTLS